MLFGCFQTLKVINLVSLAACLASSDSIIFISETIKFHQDTML